MRAAFAFALFFAAVPALARMPERDWMAEWDDAFVRCKAYQGSRPDRFPACIKLKAVGRKLIRAGLQPVPAGEGGPTPITWQ